MKLVIVESPSKAKTIGKYLGTGYYVIASGGHVCDLPVHSLGIDVGNDFTPKYEVYPEKKKIIKQIKDKLKQADSVFLATDPDREGEAISWHLQKELGIPDDDIRIEFNEISKKAVNAALQTPRKVNINLVNAQQARRVLDRLVGYKISPILNKKIKTGLSAGRVQSAALRMVVEREREIRDFKPEEYWNLYAFLTDGGKQKMKATFVDINNKKFKIGNKNQLDLVLAEIDGKDFIVDTITAKEQFVFPSPPFTTSTLQQDATNKYSMTAPQVMKVAQQLYEGIEIEGEGHVALVTYIRTDSVRISDDAYYQAKDYITQNYGKDYLPYKRNVYQTKGKAQDAHEAIRPISLERTPQSMKGKLPNQLLQIYKLIYDRFLASQMAPAIYDTVTARVAVQSGERSFGFKISGRQLKSKGYTAVYEAASAPSSNGDEDDNAKTLPSFTEGQKLIKDSLKYEQKFTKPPYRYTEASLVKGMEENGVGRPSTYANTISVMAKREYTTKEGKYLLPTALGETVCDTVNKYFPDILDLRFTAKMEEDLDLIAEGKDWKEVLRVFYPPFIKEVESAMKDYSKVKLPAEESDVVCDKCGAKMVFKEGRFGKFLACPNFPKCRNTKSLDRQVVGVCPKCGKDLISKKSKTGKVFYGCSSYPDCDFMSWDIPAPIPCPDCGGIMKITKLKNGEKYSCTKCSHIEEHPSEDNAD